MTTFKTNKLKLEALRYIEEPELPDDREIKKIDITEMYEDEVFDKMLKNKECVNQSYISRVRSGKSTICFADGMRVQRAMNKLKYTKIQWSINNIARTQYELSKKLRDSSLNNFYVSCDEFDDLDNAQANSSIEQALLKHFNKIQAGRYMHVGYCSPNEYPDDNSEIINNIDAINRPEKLTKVYVYYVHLKGITNYKQFIGYRLVDVTPVISTWVGEKLENLFYTHGTEAPNLPEIQKWRKKDWYTEYMCRKFEKMNFLNKHGIFQSRELDYADIYLQAVNEMKPMCKIKGLISQKQVKNTLKRLFREHIVPTTILGDHIMSEKVDGILDYYKEYYELQNRIIHLTEQLRQHKVDQLNYMSQKEVMEESMHKLLDGAEKEEKELDKLSKLKKVFYGEE